MKGVWKAPVAMTTARAVMAPDPVSRRHDPDGIRVTERTSTPQRTGTAKDSPYDLRYSTMSSLGKKPPGSGPEYWPPGSLIELLGVTRQKLSQRPVHADPTLSRSRTVCCVPRRVNS
jgi:hypothetical protein